MMTNKNNQTIMQYEDIATTTFTATYTKQSEYSKTNWSDNYFQLLNAYLSRGNFAIKFEMRQGCRDDNGFYPNYIYLVVEKENEEYTTDLLTRMGYTFEKRDTTFRRLYKYYDDKDYDEFCDGFDEIEFDEFF